MFLFKIKRKIVAMSTSMMLFVSNIANAKIDNMSFGINIKQFLSTSISAFYEYKPTEHIGFEIGAEYTFRDFCVIYPGGFLSFKKLNKLNYRHGGQSAGEKYDYDNMTEDNAKYILKNHTDNAKKQNAEDWGVHHYSYFSIPLIINTYPGGGSFSIYFGASFDFLISVNGFTREAEIKNHKDMLHAFNKLDDLGDSDNNKSWISEGFDIKKLKGLDKDAKRINDKGEPTSEDVYNKFGVKIIWGIKYSFPVGIFMGCEGRTTIKSFVTKKTDYAAYEGNFKIVVGFDIAKLSNFIENK